MHTGFMFCLLSQNQAMLFIWCETVWQVSRSISRCRMLTRVLLLVLCCSQNSKGHESKHRCNRKHCWQQLRRHAGWMVFWFARSSLFYFVDSKQMPHRYIFSIFTRALHCMLNYHLLQYRGRLHLVDALLERCTALLHMIIFIFGFVIITTSSRASFVLVVVVVSRSVKS